MKMVYFAGRNGYENVTVVEVRKGEGRVRWVGFDVHLTFLCPFRNTEGVGRWLGFDIHLAFLSGIGRGLFHGWRLPESGIFRVRNKRSGEK